MYLVFVQAAYTTAQSDCRAFLGDDATLLYIETQEELANVTKFIRENDDTGSSYWVGGRYDPDRDTFVWENDVEVGPWAPWDQGHPNTKTQVTRVFARTVGSLKLRTQFNTVTTRYICEMKEGEEEEEAEPCYNDNDLVIAVDSSGSIGEPDYMYALEFAARLATAWADNPNNRLSVLVYSTSVRPILSLNQNLTVAQLRDVIYNAPYLNASTNSHLALDTTIQEFQDNPRTVPHNLVFLTDGASTNQAATLVSAQNVQNAGIRSFSVGIGAAIKQAELEAIAGNDSGHVFNTGGFEDLLKLLQPVSRRVCDTNA